MINRPFLGKVSLTLLSLVLLTISFPKFSFYYFIFIALIPFLFALDKVSTKRVALGWGYFFGLIFFWGMLYWIGYVTWFGVALMIFYLALYPALFAMAYVHFKPFPTWIRLIILPCVWTVLEFIRAHFLSGFGWGALSDSQYLNLFFIQIADVTGQFGVSFLIVLANLSIKEMMSPRSKTQIGTALLGLLIIAGSYWYGFVQYHFSVLKSPEVSVGVVQPNIPLEIRWNPHFRDRIVAKHLWMSQQLLDVKPDIIVWPESAFPGIIWEEPDLFERIRDAARQWRMPLLLGVVTEVGRKYYNSAMLLNDEGNMAAQYNKNHLVPFGEYIPFRVQFPFLEHIVPIDDFTAGDKIELIPIQDVMAGVLICFEDKFAYLSREMVRQGAQVLINITNDAWFRDSREPYLHLASSVFRAVETKRSVVRAANTGISAWIDHRGRILNTIQDQEGQRVLVEGGDVYAVPLVSRATTFYTKYGNLFTYVCFLCILIALVINYIPRRGKGNFHE